jgi:hypothetical protein
MRSITRIPIVLGILVASGAAHGDAHKPFRDHSLTYEERTAISQACQAYRDKHPIAEAGRQHDKDILLLTLVTCINGDTVSETGWNLDELEVTEGASQLERASYVQSCLFPEAYENNPNLLSLGPAYAVCGHDGRNLDLKVIDSEIAALGLDPVLADVARRRAADARDFALKIAADYERLGPEYKKILVDAPDKAWAAWMALRDSHREAIADAVAVERAFEAGVRSKMEGCQDLMLRHVREYVTETRPRTESEARGVAHDPVGSRLLTALAGCEAMNKDRQQLALAALQMSGGSRRGPRAEAHNAALAALEAVKEDQTRFPLSLDADEIRPRPRLKSPEHPGRSTREHIADFIGALVYRGDWEGKVLAATPTGEGMRITFVRTTEEVPEWRCKPTNRIGRVRPDGIVEYYDECEKIGSHTVTHHSDDVVVPSALAAGLTPGRFLVYLSLGSEAFPFAVYRDDKRKELVAFLGGAVAAVAK